ncbi:MAG: hypothetical protein WD595_05795 [Waddliaceae bacterium]
MSTPTFNELPTLSTPLFYPGNDTIKPGALGKPIQQLFDWRENQQSICGRLGGKVVVLIVLTATSVLTLAESVTSLALAALTTTARLVMKNSRISDQLITRSRFAFDLSYYMISDAFYQLTF